MRVGVGQKFNTRKNDRLIDFYIDVQFIKRLLEITKAIPIF